MNDLKLLLECILIVVANRVSTNEIISIFNQLTGIYAKRKLD